MRRRRAVMPRAERGSVAPRWSMRGLRPPSTKRPGLDRADPEQSGRAQGSAARRACISFHLRPRRRAGSARRHNWAAEDIKPSSTSPSMNADARPSPAGPRIWREESQPGPWTSGPRNGDARSDGPSLIFRPILYEPTCLASGLCRVGCEPAVLREREVPVRVSVMLAPLAVGDNRDHGLLVVVTGPPGAGKLTSLGLRRLRGPGTALRWRWSCLRAHQGTGEHDPDGEGA